MRSTRVPCGTISNVIWPDRICRSASETMPGRAEKQVTRCAICPASASRCAVGWPGWPSPLQYTVSPLTPRSRSAVTRLDGNRCATPKPAMATVAPSTMSSTAAAGDETVLSIDGFPDGAPHPLRRQRHVDVADSEVGDRVDDRVLYRRDRADRTGLADSLDAQRIVRGRRLAGQQIEGRQVRRAG